MSALDDRMREIMVQGTPDLQEIYRHYIQKLQSLEDELGSIKAGGVEIRSCVCAPMAATLWSTLPNELLQQIFARLPLRDIIRLQCLSKTWKWNLTSRDSEFKRICTEATLKMFAMVSEGDAKGSISVRLYDIKANIWHSYVHHLGSHFVCVNDVCAGDGGLVCVVSESSSTGENPVIAVLNPLDPRRSRVLPRHVLQGLELHMVQLVMDRDRRCYKVLVVGEKKNGRVVTKIFSSETGAWNGEISEGLVFGHLIERISFFPEDKDSVGPCAYDSVERQLQELVDGSHPCHDRIFAQFGDADFTSKIYALVKDHLFVLHEETYEATISVGNTYECQRYCISEYQGQKCKPHWVKLKVHRCKEFELPPSYVSYVMSLYACKGFLLVKAENVESEAYRHVLTWLYDMATEKWQAIPPFADKVLCPSSDAMFELQWDAIP